MKSFSLRSRFNPNILIVVLPLLLIIGCSGFFRTITVESEQFHRVTLGMNPHEVENILGPPQQLARYPDSQYWIYNIRPFGFTAGIIKFDANATVVDIHEE